jgi:ribosomal protein L37AE/L43A
MFPSPGKRRVKKKLRCQRCNHEVQVSKGSSVLKCSKCEHDIFGSSEPNGNGQAEPKRAEFLAATAHRLTGHSDCRVVGTVCIESRFDTE